MKKYETLSYRVPQKIRLIIDTDAKNEADDSFAIVHALLTPKFDIRGIIGTHFGSQRSTQSMEDSYLECQQVVRLMGLEGQIDVLRSAKQAVKSETDYEYSDGAKRIVDEAMAEVDTHLFVIFLGPLTNLACAYLHSPEIAGRLTAIWIGGAAYPEGGEEYNLSNDVLAANIIMQSPLELWQVPNNVYCLMRVGFAELQEKVYPCGEIGKYLFDQLMECNHRFSGMFPYQWFWGESWSLGDSPAVALAMDAMPHFSTLREAPVIGSDMRYSFDGTGRKIRVYHNIDQRFVLEDMFSKLALFMKSQLPE